jgi:N-acyl-D-aspartate/D-glutamate deacylase
MGEALDRLRPGGAIYHQMDDGDLERIMAYPPSVIGSDGLPRDIRPHPRLWGSFPRVLGHYARDRGLMPLQTAIAKMTGQSARVLGLPDRGVLRQGARADLVLFAADRIADAATYESPTAAADGIARVIVNGRTAWADGKSGSAGAGAVLARLP